MFKKKYLNELDYYVFIVTNQSGIARGYYSEDKFINFQKEVNEKFTKNNIFINDTLYCPHHVDGKIKKYKINCKCRKPGTLMIKNIINNFDVDLKKSFFIGDTISDQECAKNSNLNFYFSKTDFYKTLKEIVNYNN